MTYCVAMRLKAGLLFASDTRTNAGVDHIASFGKMHQFQIPHQRGFVAFAQAAPPAQHQRQQA